MNNDAITSKIRVLAIDDDPNVTWILSDGLNEEEFEVETCNDAATAVSRLSAFQPDVCLLDIKMPGMDGIEALHHIKRADPSISVIMISGHADTPIVVRAIKGGADDFMVKPFEVEMVDICIRKVLEKKDLKQKVNRLERELERQTVQQEFIGDSQPILLVRDLVEQVGATDLNVLIRGETGTGKDVLARLVHQMSDRHRGPFVKVNCAALPGELLESELFGHERGAFTGAYKSKPGRFELAHNGTIFLDEIGEMPANLQAKLLQVLEQREFFRVGGTTNIKVNIRLITATNIDIEQKITEKEFRVDLFYRLNDITVQMPPLRDRGEDILLLANHFLGRYAEKQGIATEALRHECERELVGYSWPGNVRELESLIKRVTIFGQDEVHKYIDRHKDSTLATGKAIAAISGAAKVPNELDDSFFDGKALKEVSAEVVGKVERRAIELCLDRNGWNRKRTAKELEVSYRCLLYKIQEYSLKPESAKERVDSGPAEERSRSAA